MMIDFEPPILACVVSNRNYTFEMLRKSKECVVNIPTVEMIKKVVGCGKRRPHSQKFFCSKKTLRC